MEDLLTVSQDDVMGMDTDITAQAASLREAPGVLTVVSRDEILALGARDLSDVLLQVAGFSLAADEEGVVDVGFRGVWAHEGKMLLMIDGQELNEPLYATLQLGLHYLLRNVDRIEIIRGPGSVMYGGNAELAVVNIISRSARQIGRFDVEGNYGEFTSDKGHFADNYSQRSLQGAFGFVHEPLKLELTGQVALGQGNRSSGLFTDFNGSPSYRGTQGNESLDPLMINVGLSWGDLRLRLLVDRYHTTDRYAYDTLLPSALPGDFITYLADAQYTFRPAPKLSIVPRLTVKQQLPWHNTVQSTESFNAGYYDKEVTRSTANVTASWELEHGVSLTAGAQIIVDYASQNLPPLAYQYGQAEPFSNGKQYITYEDFAGFAQVVWINPWVNITAGGRIERHSEYGSSVVPRLALTKAIDAFHFKALVSQAFRAPSIENMHLNPMIRPEYLVAYELELGYALSRAFYIGVNAFDFTINDPIVYDAEANVDDYNNYHQTGSVGAEVDLRYRGVYGFATLGYSLAAAAGKNEVPSYAVPQTQDAVIGLPMHKGVGSAGIYIGEHWLIGPSLVVLGPRYGTLNAPGVVSATPTTFLANVMVTYRDFFLDHLDVSLGAYNFLAQPFTFIQAYNSYITDVSNGRAPTPGLDRQVLLRAAWTLE